ncbi:Protein transport protein yif1 [Rhodotorula toruloides]
MSGGPLAVRSPPPLQQPPPQHPPSQIPSQSPPPDTLAFSSSHTYQRFSSPPVQGGSHMHRNMAALYTLLNKADKAEKLRQSLPPTLKVNDVDGPVKAKK